MAAKWAQDLRRNPTQIRQEIERMLRGHAFSPVNGRFGEPIVSVLKLLLSVTLRSICWVAASALAVKECIFL